MFHPATDDITVEGILYALSDPARVRMFATLADTKDAKTCTALAESIGQPVPKSTLSQHFKVLRESGLIRSMRQGVELRNVSRCDEIEKRFPGLLRSIVEALKRQGKRARR